ncbi:hypothetical protein DQG13_13800 [Paenibacillus sp. YN15]|nr:hypothetical protein DQG13_13800 [Paenibacillus sp. YN15]
MGAFSCLSEPESRAVAPLLLPIGQGVGMMQRSGPPKALSGQGSMMQAVGWQDLRLGRGA